MPPNPAGLVRLPMPTMLQYDVPASQAAAVPQQLHAEYWQQALALAAVQQAAVAGQVTHKVWVMGLGNEIGNLRIVVFFVKELAEGADVTAKKS